MALVTVFCLSLAAGSDVPKPPPTSDVPASAVDIGHGTLCNTKFLDIPYRTHAVQKGYSYENPSPVLGHGHEEICPHCRMCPCIVLKPPGFLRGSGDAHVRNRPHRFRLYRGFWKLLKDLCLWNDDHYLEHKRRVTQEHDQREIIPSCVVDVGVLHDNIEHVCACNLIIHHL